MAGSKAKTVEAYLKELPEGRRAEIAAERKLALKHLPKGYEEAMNYGMIAWQVPLAKFPSSTWANRASGSNAPTSFPPMFLASSSPK